jgi:hypothetical protein
VTTVQSRSGSMDDVGFGAVVAAADRLLSAPS